MTANTKHHFQLSKTIFPAQVSLPFQFRSLINFPSFFPAIFFPTARTLPTVSLFTPPFLFLSLLERISILHLPPTRRRALVYALVSPFRDLEPVDAEQLPRVQLSRHKLPWPDVVEVRLHREESCATCQRRSSRVPIPFVARFNARYSASFFLLFRHVVTLWKWKRRLGFSWGSQGRDAWDLCDWIRNWVVSINLIADNDNDCNIYVWGVAGMVVQTEMIVVIGSFDKLYLIVS